MRKIEKAAILMHMDGPKRALFTFAGRISAKREAPDVAVFDEGIASAISEEKNATDGRLAAGRKLPEKVNEAPKSVAGIIFSPDRSSVLLIKRRDVPVWVLPGGGIDPNESPEHAVIREILEETGFTVKADRLVGDYIPINRLAKRTYLYECAILTGAPIISLETRGIQFFPLAKLPPLPPPYLEWIRDAERRLAPVQKKLTSVNYLTLTKNFILHPILVIRFLLARLGLSINSN